MSDITGGELLARALQAEGIEYLFGLPSPESDPLLAVLVLSLIHISEPTRPY